MPPVTVIAYLQSLMHSVSLICTNTEGPSPVVLRFYILIVTSYFGRSWQEIPHILKRPSRIYLMTGLSLYSTKILIGGLMPPF